MNVLLRQLLFGVIFSHRLPFQGRVLYLNSILSPCQELLSQFIDFLRRLTAGSAARVAGGMTVLFVTFFHVAKVFFFFEFLIKIIT